MKTQYLPVAQPAEVQPTPEDSATIEMIPSLMDPQHIRDEAKYIARGIKQSILCLSSLIHCVYEKQLYKGWGHKSFTAYIENELGFSVKTAFAMIRIERTLIGTARISREEILEIGLAKAQPLIPLVAAGIITETNRNAFVERATTMTRKALERYLRKQFPSYFQEKQTTQHKTEITDTPNDVAQSRSPEREETVLLQFYVTDEQARTIRRAIELASGNENGELEGGQDYLEVICEDYIARKTNICDAAPEPDSSNVQKRTTHLRQRKSQDDLTQLNLINDASFQPPV